MAARGDDGKLEQSIEDATVALINSDPDLREELRGLISDAIARYRHVIRWGQPEARLAAIKAIVPGLLRAMGRVEQSQNEQELRAAYDRILKGELAELQPITVDEPAPEPAPAVEVAPAPKKPRAAGGKPKKLVVE